MPTSSTSALLISARTTGHAPYMCSHTQLPLVADRTTNWGSAKDTPRPESWWLNTPQLPRCQVLAPVYQNGAKLSSQILFVKLFHMSNCRRGIEIPGNVDMSRRCGTQMQRHTRGL